MHVTILERAFTQKYESTRKQGSHNEIQSFSAQQGLIYGCSTNVYYSSRLYASKRL